MSSFDLERVVCFYPSRYDFILTGSLASAVFVSEVQARVRYKNVTCNTEGLAASWGGLFVFDTVIVTLTLLKAIEVKQTQNRKLYHALIRDGRLRTYICDLL